AEVKEAESKIEVKVLNPPTTWEEILELLTQEPFSELEVKCSEFDPKRQEEILGPLNNPVYQWPIVNDQIDMRYYSTSDGHESVREVSKELSKTIKQGTLKIFWLIAASGSGKTSAIFDLARNHYVMYIQCTDRLDMLNSVQANKNKRRSREPDESFFKLLTDVEAAKASIRERNKQISDEELKIQTWKYAVDRSAIDVFARLLLLCWLAEKLGDDITPWKFLIQQQHVSSNKFVELVSEKLLGLRFEQTKGLIVTAVSFLKKKGVLTYNRRLVVAVDEIETGINIMKGDFLKKSTPIDNDTPMKGLISPYLEAISKLRIVAEWSVIIAGTGSSYASMESLKSDVGKPEDQTKTIFLQNDFPKATVDDCCLILNRLKLPLEHGTTLKDLISDIPKISDTLIEYDLNDKNLAWIHYIRYYCVGARFRLITGAIDRLKCVDYRDDAIIRSDMLNTALKESVTSHRTRLVELIKKRIDPVNLPRREYDQNMLKYLSQIYIGSMLSDGRILFPHEDNPLKAETDLVALGMAGGYVVETNSDGYTNESYVVNERFVLEAIVKLFMADEIADAASKATFNSLVTDLNNVLIQYPSSTMHGNVCERIFLQSLVDLSKTCSNVADLPFLQRFTKRQLGKWENVPYIAKVVQSQGSMDLAEYLTSEESVGVVISPENACRPDGILMLEKGSRAITLGSKVYSRNIPSDKILEQYRSTDMSRAYFEKTRDIASVTSTQRRDSWMKANLHKVVSIRIHIALPLPVKGAYEAISKDDKKRVGESTTEQDLIVNLDMTNIHWLIGSKSDNMSFYRLLANITLRDLNEWATEP
ncbi:hypothetical protein G9A89_000207, partial [Geosiphon pyriformis]